MDVNLYRNFITIVRAGSISAAARELHIAQSALSTQVKALENRFGVKLLDAHRGLRSLKLTEAGKAFYDKITYLCRIEDVTIQEMEDMASGVGTLRICLSPSLSIAFIRNFLVEFSREYPDIHFELYEVNITEQTQRLLNGIVEIGIASAPLQQQENFDVLFTIREQLGIVVPKENPWFREEEEITIDKLRGVPLCLSRGCAELLLDTCHKDGVPVEVLSTSTTKTSAVTWARHGRGCAVIPLAFSTKFEKSLMCKIIRDERLSIDKTMTVVKGRELSPVAQKFLEYCRNQTTLQF